MEDPFGPMGMLDSDVDLGRDWIESNDVSLKTSHRKKRAVSAKTMVFPLPKYQYMTYTLSKHVLRN
jgi:hypothetical protein